MKIAKVAIRNIQPSQLYISRKKYDFVNSFMIEQAPNHNYEPISVKVLNNEIVFLDGHTRALWLINKGYRKIKIYYEEEKEWDWDGYLECIRLCKSENIFSVSDLRSRIIPHEEYKIKWYKKCSEIFKE